MFAWCCQDQQELNEQLFVYRGNSDPNSRQVIRVSQLNSAILQQDHMYQVFVASQYDSILKKCRQRREDFTDQQFNTRKQDMPKINGRKITWKRLKQFAQSTNDPLYAQKTMAEVVELNDRDSYFLASIAALSQQPATILAILDGVNSFNELGIYKLNVCVSGKPKQIVVDDFVPVFEDNHSRAAFIKAQQGALWVLLLEKAYAKLKGGYKNIVSGFAHEVLTTFTVAPCLSHVIPLKFDHASQQFVWAKLIEARKNRFPMVCGSRKQYTCKGIAMNHAYPLVDCELQQKNGNRTRIVRLVSIPAQYGQCEHNNECSFKIQGSTLKMQLVEFMRNFELIDVAHICKNFNSHFYSYKSSAGSFKFYTVDISSNISFYLTLQHNSQQKGRLRIFFAKELYNCQTDYQLISCKSQEVFSDVSLQFHNLPQGKYVVCCQSSLATDCTLRVYCEAHLAFFQFKQEPIRFLEHIFYDYALKNDEDHILLDKNNNDWFYSKTMFQEVGLGFLIIGLDNTSTIKCYLSYKKDELEKEGYRILNKVGKLYKVELVKSNIQILIFQMNQINNTQVSLEFPPRSLQMKVVI